jgi:hypothetical protein
MNKQIDKAIAAASDMVEGMLHRKFYPEIATHYFAGGDFMVNSAGELTLYGYDVISISSMIINGNLVSSDSYFLDSEPMSAGEFPGSLISISKTDEVIITGTFGYSSYDVLEATLVGGIDAVTTSLDISDSSGIFVGHTLRIESERFRVLEKQQLDSGDTITANLDAKASATLVGVNDASSFNVDETVLIDGEKMLIVDIAGNNLIVERNYDGSVLAAHTLGTVVYVPRRLKVRRAILGTTAATHADGSDVYRLTPPSLIKSLCIAEAMNIISQEKSSYARSIGSGDSLREVQGRGLADIRKAAMTNYRRYRGGAV